MRRLKFLLRPSWLALAAVVGLFAFLCFTVLAPWQLGKNTSTSHRNDLIEQSVAADPVSLDRLVTGTTFATEDEWRRVVAGGSYLQDSDALVRLRRIHEQPAYEVITPFELDDGRIIMVNRGWVRPVEGTSPPAIEPAPAGRIELEGRLRVAESTSREPIEEEGHLQVYAIAPAQIATALAVDPPVDGYLQLDDAQPGGLGLIDLPQTDSGPYLSYGLQWLAFGIMAPLGLAYFVRAELRERRKSKADAAGNGTRTPDTLDGTETDAADTAEPLVAAGSSARSSTARAAVAQQETPPQHTEDTDPPSAAGTPSTSSTIDDNFALPTRRRRTKRADRNAAPTDEREARLADRYGKRR